MVKRIRLKGVIEQLTFTELSRGERALIKAARRAIELSHSPYSRFRVGAAVGLTDGSIIPGANQENASYGLTVCAERTALWTAQNQGHGADVSAIAITGGPAGDLATPQESPISPCGACRQVIVEFEHITGRPMSILLDSLGGPIYRVAGIEAILPLPFRPHRLGGR
jgi:cytidine deaminase